jgi:riboflavin synthase
MFTGVPKEMGKILEIKEGKAVQFTIGCKKILKDLTTASSINVDGACLTVMKVNKDSFSVQLIPETRKRTAFSKKKAGDYVNLETTLKLGEPLVGGMVSALVDAVGEVTEYIKENDKWVLVIKPPKELMKYIPALAGVVVNGVGLNSGSVTEDTFEVPLYPYVIGHSNIGKLKVGDLVNLEISSTARYVVPVVEKFLREKM